MFLSRKPNLWTPPPSPIRKICRFDRLFLFKGFPMLCIVRCGYAIDKCRVNARYPTKIYFGIPDSCKAFIMVLLLPARTSNLLNTPTPCNLAPDNFAHLSFVFARRCVLAK